MRVGLTLSGDTLCEDGARFAAQLVRDVVIHPLTTRNAANAERLRGDDDKKTLRDGERMTAVVTG